MFLYVTILISHLQGSVAMGFVTGLFKVVAGAAAGVAAVTALPVFGALGAITATGVAVGSRR
jgi:hypothetical protein